MHRELGGNVLGAAVAECGEIDAGEQVLARAQENGTEGEVQFVDQPQPANIARVGGPWQPCLPRRRRAAQERDDGP